MAAKRKPSDLKKGWTTGACATAAAVAAFEGLLTGRFPDPVRIHLPRGETPMFPLSRSDLGQGTACAGVIKDAGDDPDITQGAEIVVTVARDAPGRGTVFKAGEGVGTVTRPGLPVPPGEPAINPVPRRMITEHLADIAVRLDTAPDVEVTISIPGGERLARKTLNGRLGIEGGLSILGTTGIVTPYSCSAWIEAMRQGLDVAVASGLTHVAGSTGRTSEAAVQRLLGLSDTALIEMGNFVNGLLKALQDRPVERLTLAGGFGKLAKLAQGCTNLHSKVSRADLEGLRGMLADLGADAGIRARAERCETAAQLLALARECNLALGDRVADMAREVARSRVPSGTRIDIAVFDRGGDLVGRAE